MVKTTISYNLLGIHDVFP